MKLVIDIPQEVYDNPYNYCCYALANVIKNGTPLDDIKADVDHYLVVEGFGTAYRQEVLEIIDRHIGSNDAEWKESEPLDDVVELMERSE